MLYAKDEGQMTCSIALNFQGAFFADLSKVVKKIFSMKASSIIIITSQYLWKFHSLLFSY